MPELVIENGSTEILRQASVALRGMPITLWEASGEGRFEPRASIGTDSSLPADALAEHLTRWNVPIPRGSRWVSCIADAGHWIVAPVRDRPPAPPPDGRERRRPERFVLELAGTCLGLGERAEREARRGEARVGALFENAWEAVAFLDTDGTVRFVSRAAEHILGDGAITAGANAFERVHPDDEAKARTLFARLLSLPGAPVSAEVRLRHQDGRYRTIQAAGVNRLDDPDVGAIVANFRDVTERKGVEAALRRTEELFRIVTETATDGIITVDEHSRMLFANPAAQELFGYGEAELVGQSLTMLMPERLRHRHLAAVHRYLGSGQATIPWRAVHFTGRHRDGRELDIEISLSEFTQGGQRAFTGIMRDVTTRRRAELVQATLYRISEASAQAEGLEGLLRSVHGIIGDLMPATSFCVALLDAASGMVTFPYHVDEREGDYRPQPPGRGAIAWVLRTGRPLLVTPSVRHDMIRRGEIEATREASTSWLGVPLILNERTIGVVAVQSYDPRVRHAEHDISVLQFVSTHVAQAIERVWAMERQARHLEEQQRLEDQLHQAQKMEAIGQLAGGVSHDFSNILTVILSSADAALQHLPDDHPARAEVVEVRDAAARGAELTRGLLAFSRRQPMALRELDLHELVHNLERMLRRLIPETVQLRIETEAARPLVRGDPAQLERVLVNLVVNARDAMPEGGTLTIRTGNARLGAPEPGRPFAVPEGGYVLLTVSDTGIGMDEATLQRSFDPFFTTKAAGAGTGLGLATAYGIVKQSGGWIWARSAPGHGASFYVCFPERAGAPSR